MIHLVLGKQGSGKTLFVVKRAYENYLAGRTVYSNVKLNFPFKQLDYKDIIECKLDNAVVVIDEIHQLLPARNSMSKVNREICDSFLSMVRKKGLEVYGTTQTPRKVDVRFREEADYYYTCSRFAYDGSVWGEIVHNQDLSFKVPVMINLNMTDTFNGITIKTSFLANDYYKKYDTKEIIRIKGLSV